MQLIYLRPLFEQTEKVDPKTMPFVFTEQNHHYLFPQFLHWSGARDIRRDHFGSSFNCAVLVARNYIIGSRVVIGSLFWIDETGKNDVFLIFVKSVSGKNCQLREMCPGGTLNILVRCQIVDYKASETSVCICNFEHFVLLNQN